MRKTLLNFAIVGGGRRLFTKGYYNVPIANKRVATGVEFAAELHDLCQEDMMKLYPSIAPDSRITIYDVAPKILPMFDASLSKYALETFGRDGIEIKTEHHIEELRKGLPGGSEDDNDSDCLTLKTKEDGEVGIGMCVWSTGAFRPP